MRDVDAGQMPDFAQADIVFFGGGADREQLIVKDAIVKARHELASYVADGGVLRLRTFFGIGSPFSCRREGGI